MAEQPGSCSGLIGTLASVGKKLIDSLYGLARLWDVVHIHEDISVSRPKNTDLSGLHL